MSAQRRFLSCVPHRVALRDAPTLAQVDVHVDRSDTMVALGEFAVWSFALEHWGECAQARDEHAALDAFARRTGADALRVVERITGATAVFGPDLLPASDAQIERTLEVLAEQRAQSLALLDRTPPSLLHAVDETVEQPAWMAWRTPAAILRHIADTESRAYLRWTGLPHREPVDDLRAELDASAAHIRKVLRTLPRDRIAEHRGETWTAVKLLRRLAWHERVELVFLRRRLRAAGVL